MTEATDKKIIKKIVFVVTGSALLIIGITLILTQWDYVTAIFKGAIGMVLALAGLLVLMLIKD